MMAVFAVANDVPGNAGTRHSPDKVSLVAAADQASSSISSFVAMAVNRALSSAVPTSFSYSSSSVAAVVLQGVLFSSDCGGSKRSLQGRAGAERLMAGDRGTGRERSKGCE